MPSYVFVFVVICWWYLSLYLSLSEVSFHKGSRDGTGWEEGDRLLFARTALLQRVDSWLSVKGKTLQKQQNSFRLNIELDSCFFVHNVYLFHFCVVHDYRPRLGQNYTLSKQVASMTQTEDWELELQNLILLSLDNPLYALCSKICSLWIIQSFVKPSWPLKSTTLTSKGFSIFLQEKRQFLLAWAKYEFENWHWIALWPILPTFNQCGDQT